MLRSWLTGRTLRLSAILAVFILATPAFAGPAWISIEVPPNPFDRASRDAYLLVHAYHHDNPTGVTLSGTAEGLVGGTRRTIPLQFTATSRGGTYALRKQWPSDGTWLLVISAAEHENNRATAIVEIGSRGEVASVKVPTVRRDGWDIPQPVTAAQVDAALQALAGRQLAAGARD